MFNGGVYLQCMFYVSIWMLLIRTDRAGENDLHLSSACVSSFSQWENPRPNVCTPHSLCNRDLVSYFLLQLLAIQTTCLAMPIPQCRSMLLIPATVSSQKGFLPDDDVLWLTWNHCSQATDRTRA